MRVCEKMKTPEERKTENKNLSEICIDRIYTIKEMKKQKKIKKFMRNQK